MPKKSKKILIFEGDKVNAEDFSMVARNMGYEAVVISEEIRNRNFLDKIERIVKEAEPDYVIISNVRRDDFEVARRVNMNKEKIIICANGPMAKKARDAGYVAYARQKNFSLEKIFEYIDEH